MNLIPIKGRIRFDPKDYTKKHSRQSSWKRVAIVEIKTDLCDYYARQIGVKYGMVLNLPLRGAHISFINDKGISDSDWDKLKNKYNNKEIDLICSNDFRSNGKHWWLYIPEECRVELHGIREEISLKRPYHGLHLSVGYANEKFLEHSKYCMELLNIDSGHSKKNINIVTNNHFESNINSKIRNSETWFGREAEQMVTKLQ